VQPSLGNSSYYKESPSNHYSRLVHKYESDGLGYAFSYDDVNPSGENEAGIVAGLNPTVCCINLRVLYASRLPQCCSLFLYDK
jgi:hypothetical protein